MKTTNGINPEHLQEVALILSKILADEYILYTKTRKSHWNVEGTDFHSKHLFFESQFKELDQIIDDTAERIRAIGHYPPASLKEFLDLTQLTEQTRSDNDSESFIKELLIDHEALIINIRAKLYTIAIDNFDAVTSDFLTTLMRKHEEMAWMLRSHLKD